MAEFKLESTGMKHTKRITRDGAVVGFAGQLSNDRWRAYDADNKALTGDTFPALNGVLKWFKSQS